MAFVDPVPALKEQLARIIVERLDGWSQAYAGAFIRADQSRFSNLRTGRLDRFSLQQLVRFAARVGGQTSLTVTWITRSPLHARIPPVPERMKGRDPKATP
jgi:predicted XRE-type DNA-binding protein